MSEHRNAKAGEPRLLRTKPKGKKYRHLQREMEILALPALWADSRIIRLKNLVLRSGPRDPLTKEKPYRPEERAPYGGVLGADGKRPGIKGRLNSSVRRAVKVGLGKLQRLA